MTYFDCFCSGCECFIYHNNAVDFNGIMAIALHAVERAESAPVFISNRCISVETDVNRVIPKGFRQATLEEVLLRYRNDEDFKRSLHNKGWVLTSQKGLSSSEFRRIEANGTTSSVDGDTFWHGLRPKERSYHGRGEGQVAVSLDRHREWGLFVSATGSTQIFIVFVAYVRDENADAAADAPGRAAVERSLIRKE